MARIGLDVMGGDFAPEATLSGAILALDQLNEDDKIVLIGDQGTIESYLNNKKVHSKNFDIVHATDIIEMGDHPARAFNQKPRSSISLGFQLLESNKIEGLASAGSTGAMMVGAMVTVKAIQGVIRPTIASPMPKLSGGFTIILDVGLNSDCKPDVLYQYGILGSLYAEFVFNINNPKVGLLNIGSESEKGNLLTKAAYQLMQDSKDFNFIGNIEGNELFDDKSDVIICDGFVGNVVLKEAEGFYNLIKKKNLEDDYFSRFNFEYYGNSGIRN